MLLNPTNILIFVLSGAGISCGYWGWHWYRRAKFWKKVAAHNLQHYYEKQNNCQHFYEWQYTAKVRKCKNCTKLDVVYPDQTVMPI